MDYRNENGAFESRAALKKVPRLGPKAFEQSAGFLRIRESRHPLDGSAVHPERYPVVVPVFYRIGGWSLGRGSPGVTTITTRVRPAFRERAG